MQGGKSWMSILYMPNTPSLFYPPIVVDKSNSYNIAVGADKILLDGAQGTGGWPVSVTLPNLVSNDVVSAIDYVDSNLIYIGTLFGKVYRLVNSGGGVWTATAIDAPPLPTSTTIQDIMARPNDHNVVILVMKTFPYPNVWRGVVAQDGA
jgi:hypothetical protein